MPSRGGPENFAPRAPAARCARRPSDTPGLAIDVSVVGRLACVADFDAGLRVIPESGALLLQLAAASTLLGLRARRRRVA